MRTTTRRKLILGALGGMSLPVRHALAQTDAYPSKPITFVVGYPVGGASDIFARLLAERMSQTFNQSVVVENRPGATSMIAYSQVAKAPPDGHTILMGNIAPSSINPNLYEKVPYDSAKDFAPVSLVSWVPLMVVVTPSMDVKNIQDLIAKAKASPGKIAHAVSGSGTVGHLAIELLKHSAGIDMNAINYKGDTPALNDTIAGHTQVMVPTVTAAMPFVTSGRLRVLAVTSPQRLAAWPDVPTVAESGLPGFEAVSWGGVLAPAATPRPIVDKLNAEIVRILKLPDVQQRFSAAGARAVSSTPAEFERYIADESAKWSRVIKQANIKPA